MKTCTKCGGNKELDEFQGYRLKATGEYKLNARCKPCRNADKRTPEYLAKTEARRRQRYATDPEYRKARLDGNRKYRYGITQERFDALLAEQGGGCAICRTAEPGGHGDWHVDHDHLCCSGFKACSLCVRGLLCTNCNLMLGHAKDDISLLFDAISYLRGE